MLKARIGFTLAAVICVFATSVSAASANVKFAFNGGTSEEVKGLGEEQIFTANSTPIKCKHASGTSKKITPETGTEAEQIITTAVYTECEIEGVGKATVSCEEFNFHGTGSVVEFEGMGRDTGGSVTPGTCTVTAVGGICVVTVPKQLVTAGVTYLNLDHTGEPVNMDVDIIASIKGMKYSTKGICGGLGKEGNNAEYKGTLLVVPTKLEGGVLVVNN